jgi:hypothetical protein
MQHIYIEFVKQKCPPDVINDCITNAVYEVIERNIYLSTNSHSKRSITWIK